LDDPVHAHAVRALAVEARLPVERVGDLYAVELRRLVTGARVRDFLSVLASRRVRQILRERPAPPQATQASV